MDIFPEGDPVLQPRVAVLGYPGRDAAIFLTPTGLRPGLVSRAHELNKRELIETNLIPIGYAWKPATTPVGLGNSLAVFPRVAEYSNPGLEDGIPFGEKFVVGCSISDPLLAKWVTPFVRRAISSLDLHPPNTPNGTVGGLLNYCLPPSAVVSHHLYPSCLYFSICPIGDSAGRRIAVSYPPNGASYRSKSYTSSWWLSLLRGA